MTPLHFFLYLCATAAGVFVIGLVVLILAWLFHLLRCWTLGAKA